MDKRTNSWTDRNLCSELFPRCIYQLKLDNIYKFVMLSFPY
jgi:hypothetical protein